MLAGAGKLYRALPGFDSSAAPSTAVAAFDPIPRPALYAVFLTCAPGNAADLLRRYAESWRHLQPHTSGEDLRARGLPPGPRYKEILARLRAAWLDGSVNSAEGEFKLLDLILKEQENL